MKLAQTLSPENSEQIVYLHQEDELTICVYKNKEITWLTCNEVVQTAISNAPPYRSVLPHNYVMLLPLLHDKEPKSILELGAGGFSLQRYLRLTHPNIKMMSVEISSLILDACKQGFPDFEALNYIQADAFKLVERYARENKKYDWLIVDLFYAETSPIHQNPSLFLNQGIKLLSEKGWLIINVLTKDKEKIAQLNREIKKLSTGKLYTFAVPEMQNHIILLSKKSNFSFPADIEEHNLSIF